MAESKEKLTSNELVNINEVAQARADVLISMGKKEWYKIRRKGKLKNKKSLEDQLRQIEDSMIEDE